MKDPVHLLDSSTDEFERALLGSAKRDAGSPAARRRCIAAAGPALAVLATSQTGSAAVLLSVLKAVGVGLALGAAVSGTAYVAMNGGSAAKVTAPAAAPRRASVPPPPVAVRSDVPAPEASIVSEPVAVTSPRVATAPSAALAPAVEPPPAVSAPLDRSLEREVSALDAARQALSGGDSARALAAIERYLREFPRGALGPEATYLKVRALLASGQRARAAAVGHDFLSLHPNGAGKLTQLLEQENLR